MNKNRVLFPFLLASSLHLCQAAANDCDGLLVPGEGDPKIVYLARHPRFVPSSGRTNLVVSPEIIHNLKTEQFEGVAEKSNWTWAAAAQVALKFVEVNVSQEDIVTRSQQHLGNEVPTLFQIMNSLNGHLSPMWSNHETTALKTAPESFKTILEQLDVQRRPYVASLKRSRESSEPPRSVVVYGVSYETDYTGTIIPGSVIYYDPTPGLKHRTYEMPWSEFSKRASNLFTIGIL